MAVSVALSLFVVCCYYSCSCATTAEAAPYHMRRVALRIILLLVMLAPFFCGKDYRALPYRIGSLFKSLHVVVAASRVSPVAWHAYDSISSADGVAKIRLLARPRGVCGPMSLELSL
jgi:hypothetical protein